MIVDVIYMMLYICYTYNWCYTYVTHINGVIHMIVDVIRPQICNAQIAKQQLDSV